MNYIKSFWTSNPSTSTDSGQQQNFNSVAFTTPPTNGNSFIITTSQQQRPQQLIFHTSSSLRPEMTVSPSDSFHSTSSHFEHTSEKKSHGHHHGHHHGKENKGYTGSSSEMHSIDRMQPHQNNQ